MGTIAQRKTYSFLRPYYYVPCCNNAYTTLNLMSMVTIKRFKDEYSKTRKTLVYRIHTNLYCKSESRGTNQFDSSMQVVPNILDNSKRSVHDK